MSVFGGPFMSDLEEDPFFGAHMRSMRQMSNIFQDLMPFSFMGNMNTPPFSGSTHHPSLMPFGFPGTNMNGLFTDFEAMGRNNPNVHSYSSSAVVTMSRGADGQPQVYQAASSTHSAPGGIKETKKLMSDTRSGVKKMAVGHHIGDRSHVLEREHNFRSGHSEQRQDFINIDEDEAEEFNREFQERTRRPAITASRGYPARRRLLLRDVPHDASQSGSTSLKFRRNYPALPAPSRYGRNY